ncbi:efflux RND transporter periplasmic adaptor subunit [Alsobacter sp. SYSU M60028]|uniref:Efflux RND transporter periplasmic adaptor subunit n=1 Tax=Alsobacter ponti TaxID=2962936 RepID=A0ABT1LG48_9HYPH|nr:efflux RND transporter periplasmic adaptor subunit [Alsobacter ponti]MCP8939695.1 efflux RND transporter periplasmic adaptor subunit [Alsobacter ponti]
MTLSSFRKVRRFGRVLGVAGLAVAAALAVALWRNRTITVPVAFIETSVPIRVFGLGTVESRVLSRVGFEVGATLAEVHADHGDRVSKGDVLARLSTGEQEARVAKANATVLSAQVGIEKARANLQKSRAVLAQKQEANRRKQALVGRNVVTEQSAEEAQRDEDVANADVAVAASEIEVASALLSDARAQLAFEETLLGHRTLVAPFDALVIERHKEVGTVLKAGDPVFTLIATDSYWGLAYVDEARAGFISEGQKVDARLRSRPLDAFTGRVVRIGLESDRVSEERRVYIKGDNPPARVHLGEQAEFWITVAQLDQALLVGEAAVHGFDGRQGVVWTVEDGRLRRRSVTFRHRTEDSRLEIVGGLVPGAQVVTRVTPDLREGRSARALPQADPATVR